MIATLRLSSAHWQTMRAHVEQNAPLEACGLLAGRDSQVQVGAACAESGSKSRDSIEQLYAFEWIDVQGLDLLGIFHSHPAGPETISETDIAEASYEVAHLIWSRTQGEWQPRGFWIADGQVNEVILEVVSGE